MSELKLAVGEEIVKSFNYSEQKVKGKGVTSYSDNIERQLIVTNKRIVHRMEGEKVLAQKEMPIDAADYVYSRYGLAMRNLLVPFILILLGIGMILLNKFLLKEIIGKNILLYVGIGAIVIGVVAFIILIINSRSSVYIEISGKMPEYDLIKIGASNLLTRKSAGAKKITVRVMKEVALQMVNELGALIIQLKEASKE